LSPVDKVRFDLDPVDSIVQLAPAFIHLKIKTPCKVAKQFEDWPVGPPSGTDQVPIDIMVKA